jgi:hypothetical protein
MFLPKVLRRAVTRAAAFVFSAALSALLLLLATTGCKKSADASDSALITNDRLDLMKIQQIFQGASPEVSKSLDEIETKARYRGDDEALTGLEKLASDSSLSDAQKKALTQITAWVKQKQGVPPPNQ